MTNAVEVPVKPMAFIDLVAQQRRIGVQIRAAIERVLTHGKYIMGPEVAELEQQLCAFSGAKHAISCSSGTDALLMAMMVYDIKPGDAVIVPSFTFPATQEAVAILGGTPIFVDVDPSDFNIAPQSVVDGMAVAKSMGLDLKGILGVGLYGQPADYEGLQALAESHGLWVVDDAAQSFGARIGSKRVGCLADVTTTSFFPAKPLGCYGDGGCVLTNDDNLADRMRSIRVHGKGADKYDIVRLGVNGRMDTIQAAILSEKLKIFEDELLSRNKAAEVYHDLLAKAPVQRPQIVAGRTSSWAQYTVILPEQCDRDRLQANMKAAGVPTMVYYPRPLHKQPANEAYPCAGDLPVSELLSSRVLSLPMHPYLERSQQEYVVEQLLKYLN